MMARRRWIQRVGKKTRQAELRKSTAAIRAAAESARRTHAAAGGKITYRAGDPRPRNQHGQLIAALIPDARPSIPGARERRRRAWSLRAANVDRDKRTGRFKRRR